MQISLNDGWELQWMDFGRKLAGLRNESEDLERIVVRAVHGRWTISQEVMDGYIFIAPADPDALTPEDEEKLNIVFDAGTENVGEDYVHRMILENHGQLRLFN